GVPSPNPFTTRTVVPFTLDAPTEITLDVVDALGRRVARLASGLHDEGEHRVAFDASGLTPGTYTVRLSAGTQVSTQRLVHVR
ncbi:MAG: T9SS type A sorting domain-containing protein, partial [Bacteroidota bacterium]